MIRAETTGMRNQRSYKKLTFLLASLLLFTSTGLVLAEKKPAVLPEKQAGLRTNYGKIALANLPIGQTISMTKIANAPMLIGNNYEVPILVEIRTKIPDKPKDGYAPIPDLSWIVIEPRGITVPARGSVQVDVKVSLPDDEKLLGQKYVCQIILYTEGDPNVRAVRFGSQIAGFFMFSIAPVRNETGLEEALNNPADAAYELVPPTVVMKGVKPGQKLKVRTELKKKVELVNRSTKDQIYWFYSVDPREHNFALPGKSRFGGNVDDVIFEEDQVRLGAGGKKALNITIQVPADADMNEESLAYLVSVTSGKRQGINRFLAIYLNSEEFEKKHKHEIGAPQAVTPVAETK